MKRADVKDIINIQDTNGNTPLHLCVIRGNYKLCDELIYAGANPLIKNNAGLYVESESESSSVKEEIKLQATPLKIASEIMSANR